ncbi:MAG: tetraacyldisaccharide 4'-kinase [Terracidiphilus sp.]
MNRGWLAPLTPLYAAAVAWRNRRIESGAEPVRRLAWPVVSIGNLSTGGAGKTPLTIALARALRERGFQVDVLSRGYGRSSRSAARVLADGTAEQFGDEPLEIAQAAGVPVWVARERYEAGLLAEAQGDTEAVPRVHLLDDGFQHRQLARDADILLLSARDLGDRPLPAGNLREPLRNLQRATVIAVDAGEPEVERFLRQAIPADHNSKAARWAGPVWRLRRRMEIPSVSGPALAFCGIARPEQFFAGLESGGLRLAARCAFADHRRYTARDLERLAAKARAAGATALVTTEKDRARLGALVAALPETLSLVTARLTVEIEDEGAALNWLVNHLRPA